MSTLKADTIQSTSGGAATLTKQSAAKMFHVFNGTGTVATSSSFNVSSLTDEGTGDYTTAFSSAFSSANFSNSANNNYYGYGEIQAKTTTTIRNRVRGNGTYTTLVDTSIIDLSNHGDLA
jgi:hypothetical protein